MDSAHIVATGCAFMNTDVRLSRFNRFCDECFVESASLEVRTSSVYERYYNWCLAQGYRPENVRGLNKLLSGKYSLARKRPADRSGGLTTILLNVGLKPNCE